MSRLQRVYMRGLVLRGFFPFSPLPGASGPQSRGWRADKVREGTWLNHAHPDHAVRQITSVLWGAFQRVRSRVAMPLLEAAARSFTGNATTTVDSPSVYPRGLRVRLRVATGVALELEDDPARCRPWGESTYTNVAGQDVELRVSRATGKAGTSLSADLFVGPHLDGDDERRAMLYLADAPRVFQPAGPAAADAFTACLLDKLRTFVAGLQSNGLEPDDRGRQLPLLAVGREVGGVEAFDVRMPTPTGTRRIAVFGPHDWVPVDKADIGCFGSRIAGGAS